MNKDKQANTSVANTLIEKKKREINVKVKISLFHFYDFQYLTILQHHRLHHLR